MLDWLESKVIYWAYLTQQRQNRANKKLNCRRHTAQRCICRLPPSCNYFDSQGTNTKQCWKWSEQKISFFCIPVYYNILGYMGRKWSQQKLTNKFVGTRRQFGGQFPVPLPIVTMLKMTRSSRGRRSRGGLGIWHILSIKHFLTWIIPYFH